MSYLDRIFDFIMAVYLVLAKIFLLAMVLIISLQVFFRYVLNHSISWSEEIAMLLMVIFGFISIAIGVQKGLHLSISLFYNTFPSPLKTVCNKISDLAVMGCGIVMMVYGVPLIKSTMKAPIPGVNLPAASLYLIIPMTGLLITYYAFGDLIGHKRRAADKEGIIE
jgi:TRAP-type transport system small permease protein